MLTHVEFYIFIKRHGAHLAYMLMCDCYFIYAHGLNHSSRVMRKTDFSLRENKGADQLCSNCTADQRLCFRFMDSTIPPLCIPEISRV